MKADVRDTAVLRALVPADVAAYLRSRAWVPVEHGDRASLWMAEGQRDIGFELPVDRGLADYPARMAEVLEAIAGAEGRSQLQVLFDLAQSGHDIVRLRAVSPGATETGTILIDAGVDLLDHGREMMLAAASATVERRQYFPTRKPTPAVEYMGRVRLGRSEAGSFIMTLLSPVAPLLRGGAQPDLGLEEPFERKVTLTLARSLSALRHAAQQAIMTDSMEHFEAAVEQGVSGNLCTAVAGMVKGIGDTGELGVAVSWSPLRPVDAQVPQETRFGPDIAPAIREAARIFRAAAPIDDHHVVGFVIRLDQRPDATQGRVAVLTVAADQSTATISMTLEQDQYAVAHRAHGDKLPVSVVGRLVRIGQRFELDSPRDLRIVPGEEEPTD